MERVACQVDESRAAVEAVRAAIEYCVEHDAALELVGVIRERALEALKPAVGGRIRRFKDVQHALARAERAARAAGLEPTVAIRSGKPEQEVLSDAERTGAVEAFLGRTHGGLMAAFTRRPGSR